MLKDVIKVSLLQKGWNDMINNIVSVFYGIQCSLNNFSWVRPSWQIPAQTITLPSPKRSDSCTHWSVKRSSRLRYIQYHSSLQRSENLNSSLGVQIHVVFCELSHPKFRCLPVQVFYRSVLSHYCTVKRYIRRKCLSWRCDVTRGLPLRGLSFVLPVCRRWITSPEMVILKSSSTALWIFPAWTSLRSFWRSRGIYVLFKIQAFRMANCLVLLTVQLMTTIYFDA